MPAEGRRGSQQTRTTRSKILGVETTEEEMFYLRERKRALSIRGSDEMEWVFVTWGEARLKAKMVHLSRLVTP